MRAWMRTGEPRMYSLLTSTRPRAAFAFRFAAMYFIVFTQNRWKYSFPVGGSKANIRYISPDAMKHVRHPADGLFVTIHGRRALSPRSSSSTKSASTFDPGFTSFTG